MANKLNLDRSQRVDIVCRKNDTFSLKLKIEDSSGVAVDLSSGWEFNMDVRHADTDNTLATNRIMSTQITSGTGSITTTGVGSMSPSGEVIFTCSASDMGVESGLYVYDIQQVDTSASPNTVETILYGTFQINEDVNITV